jgi:hypothetical protein
VPRNKETRSREDIEKERGKTYDYAHATNQLSATLRFFYVFVQATHVSKLVIFWVPLGKFWCAAWQTRLCITISNNCMPSKGAIQIVSARTPPTIFCGATAPWQISGALSLFRLCLPLLIDCGWHHLDSLKEYRRATEDASQAIALSPQHTK